MKPKRRKNEISAVVHRSLMERTPDGIDTHKWHTFRERYNRASKLERLDAPPQLDIELNSACNLKCSFCIQSVMNMGRSKLGMDCFVKLVDEALANGTTSLKLNYQNEPLLLPDLEEYIRYAKRAGMVNVFFSTNGILLKPERAESLIRAGLTKIFISIDATDAETYHKQRGADVYHKVVDNVRNFVKIRQFIKGDEVSTPYVRVNFLKTRTNQGQEQAFIDMWEGIADMVIIQQMNELIDNTTDEFIPPKFRDFKCSFPFKQLVVRANGDILPCCPMNGIKHKVGHVDTMTLTEAWNSDKVRYLQDLHQRGDYKKDDICRHCIDGK